LKQHHKRNDEQDYDHPKCKIPEIRIHLRSRYTSFRPRGHHWFKSAPVKKRALSNVSLVFPIAKGVLYYGQDPAPSISGGFPVRGALCLPA
jgi:hypothetical protein